MSMAEILEELPRLNEGERRAVRRRLQQLESEREEIALCDRAAAEGMQMLDRMEAEDACREAR